MLGEASTPPPPPLAPPPPPSTAASRLPVIPRAPHVMNLQYTCTGGTELCLNNTHQPPFLYMRMYYRARALWLRTLSRPPPLGPSRNSRRGEPASISGAAYFERHSIHWAVHHRRAGGIGREIDRCALPGGNITDKFNARLLAAGCTAYSPLSSGHVHGDYHWGEQLYAGIPVWKGREEPVSFEADSAGAACFGVCKKARRLLQCHALGPGREVILDLRDTASHIYGDLPDYTYEIRRAAVYYALDGDSIWPDDVSLCPQ